MAGLPVFCNRCYEISDADGVTGTDADMQPFDSDIAPEDRWAMAQEQQPQQMTLEDLGRWLQGVTEAPVPVQRLDPHIAICRLHQQIYGHRMTLGQVIARELEAAYTAYGTMLAPYDPVQRGRRNADALHTRVLALPTALPPACKFF